MELGNTHISVRFKHGVHTIYLFIDSLEPFSHVTAELVKAIEDRYPKGLTTSVAPPKTTVISEGTTLAYAVLDVPNDPSRGWKRLKIDADGSQIPQKVGLKNNSIVAFTPVDDVDDDDVVFEVEWPREEDLEEQEG